MSAEVLPLYKGMEVEEVEVAKIKTKFRLRTPNDDKIKEVATSIKLCGLINPITVTRELYLLAGYHRWKAYEQLGYKPYPQSFTTKISLRVNWLR